ncbi:MAG: hypothetical protein ACI92I_000718 [Acidimicrobiales bacterium]
MKKLESIRVFVWGIIVGIIACVTAQVVWTYTTSKIPTLTVDYSTLSGNLTEEGNTIVLIGLFSLIILGLIVQGVIAVFVQLGRFIIWLFADLRTLRSKQKPKTIVRTKTTKRVTAEKPAGSQPSSSSKPPKPEQPKTAQIKNESVVVDGNDGKKPTVSPDKPQHRKQVFGPHLPEAGLPAT